MEVDIVSIKEIFWDMRRLVWIARKLGVSGNVDSTKCNLPPMGIAEVSILNRESQGCHGVQLRTSKLQIPARSASWLSIYVEGPREYAAC